MNSPTKRAMSASVIVGILLAAAPGGYAQISNEVVIDFITGKFNGSNIFELTADIITDMLGRPSATRASRIELSDKGNNKLVGPQIQYREK
jgi:hypothetical protein